MATLKNTIINDTGFIQLPAGTTAQRPAAPQNGHSRLNTDFNTIEYYQNGSWYALDGKVYASATGSVYTANIVDDNVPYKVHVFTENGTFKEQNGPVADQVNQNSKPELAVKLPPAPVEMEDFSKN